jgi:hypothetical protein
MNIAECPDCGERVSTFPAGDVMRFVEHDDCPGWFRQVDWPGGDTSEGRFTLPRADCPNPERWHSDDADSTEYEVSALVGGFVRALQPDLVVETGSAWGQTAFRIGQALLDNGRGTLHTIEPDQTRADHTRVRCEDLPVVVEQMKSMDWTPPGPIGFAWFDSLANLRVPEFLSYFPWLQAGAIVGFHDTGPHQGTLRADVEELEMLGHLLLIHLPTPRGVTFGQVLK